MHKILKKVKPLNDENSIVKGQNYQVNVKITWKIYLQRSFFFQMRLKNC